MKRVVYAAEKLVDASSWVRRLGKFLNKHIDGAYKIEFHPSDCDIYMRMYYQVPDVPESFDEMKFIINVATYQNKLRINLTENNEYEKTIGQLIIQPEEVVSLEEIKRRVAKMIRKSINKEFDNFEFVY